MVVMQARTGKGMGYKGPQGNLIAIVHGHAAKLHEHNAIVCIQLALHMLPSLGHG